jgi:adenylate kinase
VVERPSVQVSAARQDSDEIAVLVAEVRKLITSTEFGQSSNSADRVLADVHEMTESVLTLLESLPDRLARAISAALAKQHELIMNDVHRAIQQVTSQLRPSPEHDQA